MHKSSAQSIARTIILHCQPQNELKCLKPFDRISIGEEASADALAHALDNALADAMAEALADPLADGLLTP